MPEIKTAVVSVADKTGLPAFARRLIERGVDLIATSGTARVLAEHDIPAESVEEYTGFPEILDGRVKTLHPKLHAGLLALRGREEHRREMEEHDIRPIDMVVVNLYPISGLTSASDTQALQAGQSIDIGGSTLVRSAAKNYTHVAVVTNPDRYEEVAGELEARGALSEETHFRLAFEAFHHTAHYDRAVADYLASIHGDREAAPQRLTLEFGKRYDLPHGENPHQRAAFYTAEHPPEPCVGRARQIGGPKPSFNDILNADAGVELVREFERPTAVLTARANPCRAASADSLEAALRAAFTHVPRGASGCALVVNRPLSEAAARAASDRLGAAGVDVVVAPDFEPGAAEMLEEGAPVERLRLLAVGSLGEGAAAERAKDLKRVAGGLLLQDRDLGGRLRKETRPASERMPDDCEMRDLQFALTCCKHAHSHAAVLARDEAVLGLGCGQAGRADAVELALRQAADGAAGAALAVDYPVCCIDVLERAVESGVRALVQPEGSEHDNRIVAAADRLGLALLFTGTTHLRH